MSDTKDLDQAVKALSKMIDDWGKEIEKIGKAMEKLDADAKKGEGQGSGADKKKDPDLRKALEQLGDDADDANKDLQKKITTYKLPPKADPKQALKLPDLLTKNISKNGLRLGDYGSVKPDIDIDFKKMQFKKVGVTWTWTW